MIRIDIATLFPDMCEAVLSQSIVGRGRAAGYIDIRCHNIRDYAGNKHNRVDDKPYGGGTGMVMQAQPIYDCISAVKSDIGKEARVIYMSPQGRVLTQDIVKELAAEENLIILCGHYEGVDQRVLDELCAEEISVGDYVLTGGELPALILTDAVARLQQGVLPNSDAYSIESHYSGLLEHPQYTRPEVWHGREVPQVLLTGAHDSVAKWQEEAALEVTRKKRPDMLYDRRVGGEPLARYMKVSVFCEGREYDIVRYMKMIMHRRVLTNREQKLLKRMLPVLETLPAPPEDIPKGAEVWLVSCNASRHIELYAPLFDMLREHGISYSVNCTDKPSGRVISENEYYCVFADSEIN